MRGSQNYNATDDRLRNAITPALTEVKLTNTQRDNLISIIMTWYHDELGKVGEIARPQIEVALLDRMRQDMLERISYSNFTDTYRIVVEVFGEYSQQRQERRRGSLGNYYERP